MQSIEHIVNYDGLLQKKSEVYSFPQRQGFLEHVLSFLQRQVFHKPQAYRVIEKRWVIVQPRPDFKGIKKFTKKSNRLYLSPRPLKSSLI
ncbi:MAG: hypothetical protein WAJ93_01465 [Candidatus Nitrosopolaris sp.]